MKLYKVNAQTIMNGHLVGVGTYDADRIGSTKIPFIEEYCANQKKLPLDKRDIPPYFEIIDTEKPKAESVDEKLNQQFEGYVGLQKKELLELCKQRGLSVNSRMQNAELINLLTEDDKKEVSDEQDKLFTFKSSDEFLELDVSEQVDYLDSIFALPDGVEENSDEETEYMDSMIEAVTMYGGLSLEQEAIDKIKEILEWANGEE